MPRRATLSASRSAFLISGNANPFRGSFNVKEGYIDTLVPLAKDALLAKSLTFSGAARYEHYERHRQTTHLEGRPGLRAGERLAPARHALDRHPRSRRSSSCTAPVRC